jgi:ornithine lipid ester-linked acyl 2-hydroxylase
MFRFIQWVMDSLIRVCSRNGKLPFWDNASFQWISRLEANWQPIRNEFDRVMQEHSRIPGLGDISEDANLGLDGKPLSRAGEWKWFFLFAYGHKIQEHCNRCPKTAEIVESIPGMRSAVFTVLAPRKHVPAHRGLYKGLLRCHLGVRIPAPASLCRIRVADQTRSWEEGSVFVFDDTQPHEVWNDSNDRRIVLILDVERPLSFPLAALNRIILRWIYSTKYVTDGVARLTIPNPDVSPQPATKTATMMGPS